MVRFDHKEKELMWYSGDFLFAVSPRMPLDAKVIDLGGGQSPHAGAQYVMDKYWDDNTHRMGKVDAAHDLQMEITDNERNIIGVQKYEPRNVGGDILHMPFPDKAFDFAICCHTLEHLDDPVAACKEISRIAKAGFIEVPRFISEWLYPQGAIHKFVFNIVDGIFIATPITWESPFGRLMHNAHWNIDGFSDAWAKSRFVFHAFMMWEGSVECRVE